MIKEFKGKFEWLDSRYLIEIPYEDIIYPSVGHALYAAQTKDNVLRVAIANTDYSELKKFHQALGEPYHGFKGADVMRQLLELKFAYEFPKGARNPSEHMVLLKKLLDTEDCKIEFGNNIHSRFWGKCYCPDHFTDPGKNVLGGLLMGVRRKIFIAIADSHNLYARCVCGNTSGLFYLYTHNNEQKLVSYCESCQVDAARRALNASQDKKIITLRQNLLKKMADSDEKIIHLRDKIRQSAITQQIFDSQEEEDEDDSLPWSEVRLEPPQHRHHAPMGMPEQMKIWAMRRAGYAQDDEPRKYEVKIMKLSGL